MPLLPSKTLADTDLKSDYKVEEPEMQKVDDSAPGESCTTPDVMESIKSTESSPKDFNIDATKAHCEERVEIDYSETLPQQIAQSFQDYIIPSIDVEFSAESKADMETDLKKSDSALKSGISETVKISDATEGHGLVSTSPLITKKNLEHSNTIMQGNPELMNRNTQIMLYSPSTDPLKCFEILHGQIIDKETSEESCSRQKCSIDKALVQDTEISDVHETKAMQGKDKCVKKTVCESKEDLQLQSILSQIEDDYLSDSEEKELKQEKIKLSKRRVKDTSGDGSLPEFDNPKELKAYLNRSNVSKCEDSETKSEFSTIRNADGFASVPEPQSTSINVMTSEKSQGEDSETKSEFPTIRNADGFASAPEPQSTSTNVMTSGKSQYDAKRSSMEKVLLSSKKDLDNFKNFDTLYESKMAQIPQLHFPEGQMTIPIVKTSTIPNCRSIQEIRVHDGMYKITIDISGFTEKDMSLQVVKDTMWFYAKQENESGYGKGYREMSRMFKIPKSVFKTGFKASIIPNNFLFISAPMGVSRKMK